MTRPRAAPSRAPRRARTAVDSETVLTLRSVPSPRMRRPEPREPAGAGTVPTPRREGQPPPARPSRDGEIDWARIEELASKGLSLDQIVVEMNWRGLPPPSLRVRVEAAIKRGRAKGSAELKRVHYEAALNGSVSAQKDMLALLEQQDLDEFDELPEVERVILGAQAKESPESERQD